MKSRILISLGVVAAAAVIFVIAITRDGERVVPRGAGVVALEAGDFEAFPLPDDAARFVTDRYRSYFIEVEPGIKVHVLEVGSGFPLVLLHGNPTSGFLYRKVAAALPTERVRVIMPTLVGLGFSSKVPASEHTLDNHVRWIGGVLQELRLAEAVFAGQDWGGPIGMGAFARSRDFAPKLLKGVVVLNTLFGDREGEGDLSQGHRMAARPVVGEIVFEVLLSIFRNLPRTQGDPDSLPDEVLDLYARPVEESGNDKAPLAMMRMVPNGPDHPSTPAMTVIGQYVRELDIPAEIVWGKHDPILGDQLPAMQRSFPDEPVTETEGGHFLQEEVPDEIATALMRVVDRVQEASG